MVPLHPDYQFLIIKGLTLNITQMIYFLSMDLLLWASRCLRT